MSTEEKQQLLNAEEKKGLEPSHSLGNGSKMNETMLIFAMLFINVLVVCVDTMPETFFNYEAKRRGLKEYQNGIVIGCYDFGRLIAGPVCPFMVRKFTAKKSMILGAATCGIASILLGVSACMEQPQSLFILFSIMRTISGAGAILYNVSSTAILMQSKFYSNATIFGWIELALGLGCLLGGLVGGVLIKFVGFVYSFIVIGGIVSMSAIPCIFFVPNMMDIAAGGDTKGIGDFIKLPGTVILLMLCVTSFYGAMGTYVMTGDWVVSTFGVTISTWSLYYTGAPLMYIVGNLVASAVTNRGYIYSTILITAPFYILCFLFMCPSPLLYHLFKYNHYLPMTVILFGVQAFLQAHILVPLYQALVNLALVNGYDADSVNTYAIISSTVNFGMAVGAMLGSPLTGVAKQYLGFPWATTIIAFVDLIVLTMLAVFLIIIRALGKPLS